MARHDAPHDPLGAFNFRLEIDAVVHGGFSECTGLDSESDIIEYRLGTDDNTVRKIPGLNKFSNVTLKRGFSTNMDLWDWRRTVMNGVIERRTVTIILLEETGQTEKLRWNLRAAWPSKWTGAELKSSANEIAIETLEFCHEGVEMIPTS